MPDTTSDQSHTLKSLRSLVNASHWCLHGDFRWLTWSETPADSPVVLFPEEVYTLVPSLMDRSTLSVSFGGIFKTLAFVSVKIQPRLPDEENWQLRFKIFSLRSSTLSVSPDQRKEWQQLRLLMVDVVSWWDQIHGNAFCSTERWKLKKRACWSENWSRHWLSEPIRNSSNYGGGSGGGLHWITFKLSYKWCNIISYTNWSYLQRAA